MAAKKQQHVVGVFDDRAKADTCFNELMALGVPESSITVMMSDQTRARYYSVDAETKGSKAGSRTTEGAGVGGVIGTAVGATIAAIAAVGSTITFPLIGVVVAGPLAAGLAGGSAGALAGTLLGGLVGMGMTEQNASAYNEALLSGGVVIAVSPFDGAEARRIEDTMVRCGGREVATQ
jgi:hypothetical protein